MNRDLIDRAELPDVRIEIPKRLDDETCRIISGLVQAFQTVIKSAPTVDAEVVRHGKWEAVKNTGPEEWCAPPIRCSNCGKTMPDVGADFCPFCGQMNAEVQDGTK